MTHEELLTSKVNFRELEFIKQLFTKPLQKWNLAHLVSCTQK